jgi:hypothetical protein
MEESNTNQESNKGQESKNEWKERELGALWKKSGKTQNYFSGRINISKIADEDGFVNIVGFSNKRKSENPNAPDVIIYFSPSASDGLSLNNSGNSSSETKVSKPEKAKVKEADASSGDIAEDETPF